MCAISYLCRYQSNSLITFLGLRVLRLLFLTCRPVQSQIKFIELCKQQSLSHRDSMRPLYIYLQHLHTPSSQFSGVSLAKTTMRQEIFKKCYWLWKEHQGSLYIIADIGAVMFKGVPNSAISKLFSPKLPQATCKIHIDASMSH